MVTGTTVGPPAHDAVLTLRRARRSARLGRLEWFEVAYRAYLVALVGGVVILALANGVPASPVASATLDTVRERGPAVVGLVAAVVLAAGLRSGAHGGPVAVEAPDIRYLLLAPVPRRRVLLRPCVQRLSSLALAGAGVGGAAGLLASERLSGSGLSWTITGAVVGATIGAGTGALALVAHARRAMPSVVHAVTAAAVAVQAVAVAGRLPGPTTVLGDVALWPLTRSTASLLAGAVGLAVAAALVALGLLWCGRLRPEALERRSALVAQLRFALAVGDLRTVVLLRRQLAHDHLRHRPWVTLRPPRHVPPQVTRVLMWRSAAAMARLPARRLVRLVTLASASGVAAAGVVEGSIALVPLLAAGTFLIGLELTETLAQTVDQSETRQLLPLNSRTLLGGVLIVPALAAIPLAALGVAAAAVVSTSTTSWGVGAIVGLPLMWAGMAGAVVNVVRGAPDPLARATRAMAMPPEVAGVSTAVQAVWPLVVSILGVGPLWFVADAQTQGGSPVAAGVRAAVASLLVAAAVVAWVRNRDDMRRRWRTLVAAGDEARRQAASRRRAGSGAA